MKKILLELQSAFEKHADPENAVAMSAYMKNKFRYYGIPRPLRIVIIKPFFARLKNLDEQKLEQAVLWLWKQPQREFLYFAMELLRKNKKSWTVNSIKLFEKLVVTGSWWDTVDYIASNLVGPYFRLWENEKEKYVRKWSAHKNMWLNRTAILFQLKYKVETDFSLLISAIKPHLSSDEFFLQKAIGWSLRQYAYTDEKSVIRFVNKTKLKPLSRREAFKHIDAG